MYSLVCTSILSTTQKFNDFLILKFAIQIQISNASKSPMVFPQEIVIANSKRFTIDKLNQRFVLMLNNFIQIIVYLLIYLFKSC